MTQNLEAYDLTDATPDAQADGIISFVDYNRVVLDLSADLRKLADHAHTLDLADSAELIAKVLDRLENDVFSVAVVGEFKRGKSTFINALLGVEVLPTDVLPTTATLNRVTFGVDKRVTIDYKDGRAEVIEYDRLSEYVTKMSSEAEEVAKTIKNATVYYPSPYCRNRVDVIDTPGLNDDEAMTEVTLGVLPEVDAAILVIIAQSPFGEYERQFLETRLLSSDLGRVIFVVNAIDRCNTPEEAERLVEGVRLRIAGNVMERAKRQFGEGSEQFGLYVRKIGKPRVFGVSAYQALKAKTTNDLSLLETSNFPAFEAELQKFLTEHRGAMMLHVPLNRALTASREILDSIALQQRALKVKAEEFEQAVAAAEADVEALRVRKAEEIAKIDAAGRDLSNRVMSFAPGFIERVRNAVLGEIDRFEITGQHVSSVAGRKEFDSALNNRINGAVTAVIDDQTLALQGAVEVALSREIKRLQGFGQDVSSLMGLITRRFTDISGEAEKRDRGAMGEGVAAALSVVTGFGGIWGGYRSAGWRGAGVGSAATLGTTAVGAFALGILSLPFTFPALLALGVASFFTGGWAADKFLKSRKIESFRQKVRDGAEKRLRENLDEQEVRHRFQSAAHEAFAAFRDSVIAETDSTLNAATTTLAKLRQQHARGQAQTDEEARTVAAIRRDVEAIAERAVRLSGQLAQAEGI